MKVLIFAGREHHALKLHNLYRAMVNAGDDVKFLVTTNSINIDPSTEFIYHYGEFTHAFDYLSGNVISRARAIASKLGEYSLNKELTRYIPPFWIAHSIQEAAESIATFDAALEAEAPDAVIALHANNFWARILFYLAQDKGIPTFAYQEGLLRHRDQETMNKQASAADYVDVIFTWSESDKSAYLDAGVDENAVAPVGPFHLDEYLQIKNSNEALAEVTISMKKRYGALQRPLISFMPPITSRYEGSYNEAIEILATHCLNNNYQLVVKPHPFDYPSFDKMEKGLKIKRAALCRDVNPLPLMLASDVVVGQHSTTAIESIFLGTPFIEADFNNVGIEQSLHFVPTINRVSELDKIVNGHFDVAAADKWYREMGTLADGYATERAINIIREMA